VRPAFDLPNYRGLKLKRYAKDYGEAEVAETRRRLLADHSQVVPKEGGAAELGDIVVAEVTVRAEFVWELSLGIWLIVKGFDPSAVARLRHESQ
jgi:FKBP-type peptidyl-prolyl cis-trans isomerase (trigger factor)